MEFAWKEREKKTRGKDFVRSQIYFPEEGTPEARRLELNKDFHLVPLCKKIKGTEEALLPDKDYHDAR